MSLPTKEFVRRFPPTLAVEREYEKAVAALNRKFDGLRKPLLDERRAVLQNPEGCDVEGFLTQALDTLTLPEARRGNLAAGDVEASKLLILLSVSTLGRIW